MTLDRFAHPTLVVVDMQNDFVRVGAPLEVPEARATIPAFTEPVLLAQGCREGQRSPPSNPDRHGGDTKIQSIRIPGGPGRSLERLQRPTALECAFESPRVSCGLLPPSGSCGRQSGC
jgi:hypothetical protein